MTGFFGIQSRIIEKLEELRKTLGELENRGVQNTAGRRISDAVSKLKSYEEPFFVSRRYIDSSLNLLRTINDAVFILNRNRDLTSEEVYSIIRNVVNGVENYMQVLRWERIRSAIFFYTPILGAVAVYGLALIFDIIYNAFPYGELIPAILSLLAVLIIKYRLTYSYIIILAASIYHLFTIPYGSLHAMESYLIIIDILILLSATSYFQLVRSVRSRRFRERIDGLMKEFEEIDRKLREPAEKPENKMLLAELEEKARRLYRKYYGEMGDALLRYKVNVMVMHGKTMEAALKEIIKSLSGKQDNRLPI